MNHKQVFPKRIAKAKHYGFMPPVAEQFLCCIICDKKQRKSAEELRSVPFFASVDFAMLHETQPPFTPKVSGPGDPSNFDEAKKSRQELPKQRKGVRKDESLEWAGYEFNR